jgi:Tfp pilus assembly PilM family ATPase
MFARTKLETYSYALALHCVANDIAPQHSNMSLLDVTHECTELSIIRDSELTYVTHAPFGIYAIAREYAAALDVPLAEALGYLKSDADSLLESLSKSKQEELEAIHDAYVARLTELFTQTGDDLVIPRQIILHIDAQYEAFLHELVTTATKRTLRSEPVVVYASSTIFANLEKSDKARIAGSAAAVSMHFFHTGNQCITIEHE